MNAVEAGWCADYFSVAMDRRKYVNCAEWSRNDSASKLVEFAHVRQKHPHPFCVAINYCTAFNCFECQQLCENFSLCKLSYRKFNSCVRSSVINIDKHSYKKSNVTVTIVILNCHACDGQHTYR